MGVVWMWCVGSVVKCSIFRLPFLPNFFLFRNLVIPKRRFFKPCLEIHKRLLIRI
jgi:hypothetical protein